MSKDKVSTATLRISRVIKAPAERVYKAFLDPDQLTKLLPPGGYTGKVYKMEAKVAGPTAWASLPLTRRTRTCSGASTSNSPRRQLCGV